MSLVSINKVCNGDTGGVLKGKLIPGPLERGVEGRVNEGTSSYSAVEEESASCIIGGTVWP